MVRSSPLSLVWSVAVAGGAAVVEVVDEASAPSAAFVSPPPPHAVAVRESRTTADPTAVVMVPRFMMVSKDSPNGRSTRSNDIQTVILEQFRADSISGRARAPAKGHPSATVVADERAHHGNRQDGGVDGGDVEVR